MVREIDSARVNTPAYDATVEQFDAKTQNLEQEDLVVRKKFAELVPERGKILDLACGPGRDARIFSELGFEVIGVDASEKMIAKARQRAPKSSFHVMDIRKLPFYANTFDAVFFSQGLLCIEKRYAPGVLKKIHEILVIGGVLFVSVKEGEGEGVELDSRYGHEKYFAYYSKEEMKQLINNEGFELLEFFRPELTSPYHKYRWIYALARKI